MVYAPVIITTLNRKVHLKRCIESLQRNSWAKYTTLIIGVDYPPSEKYQAGYHEVCAYLQKEIEGFAKVEITYHKENLGPHENFLFLARTIREWCDRYIFTEDDNEMSPNFIEFIDKGLELFEHNDSVLAICSTGAENEQESPEENVVLTHNYSAHGYGTWFKKEDEFSAQITREYFENIGRSIKTLWKLYRYDPELVFTCQSAIFRKEKLYQISDGSIPIIDMTIKVYSVLENKYVVCPCIKKSRNWGYDGSGVNCLNVKGRLRNVAIDGRKNFDFHFSEEMKISKVQKKYSLEIKGRIFVAIFRLKARRVLRRQFG